MVRVDREDDPDNRRKAYMCAGCMPPVSGETPF